MSGIEPSTNGDTPAVKKKRPKKAKEPFQAGGIRIQPTPKGADEPQSRGRLASEIEEERVSWLLRPWIPKGMLSFIVGQPGTGKSTLAAWLISEAGQAVLFPGYEEKVSIMTIPRLKANAVSMKSLRLLDDRHYTFPRDETRVINIVRGWQAEIVVLDPVDSYMDEGMKESDGQAVREYLESLARIASETGAAVVGVRHPGKDSKNVCPGSRQWRAVPRCIVELLTIGEVSPRLIMRLYKDSLGSDSRPRQFYLQGERGKPRVFDMKQEVDASFADLASAAFNPAERQDVVECCRVIKHLFETEEEPTVQEFLKRAETNGHSRGTCREALYQARIHRKPGGKGAPWILVRLSKKWPDWLVEAETGQEEGIALPH